MDASHTDGRRATDTRSCGRAENPIGDAEHLKLQYGHAHTGLAPPKEMVQVKNLQTVLRKISACNS